MFDRGEMSELIGQQLRKARQERKASLEEVAHVTRIRQHYLEALEAGDLGRLPSPVQARGFLRAYASFLGLNAEDLMSSLDADLAPLSIAPPISAPLPPTAPAEGEKETIFSEIGQALQRRRELLGLSLADVERHTHLRMVFLQALEAGNLDDLPSSVQGRGMLNNYAAFLGLDTEPLLLRFAEGLQAGLAARKALRSQPKPTRKRMRAPVVRSGRLISRDLLLGGMLILVLLGFVSWGVLRVIALRSASGPTPTVLSIAEALQPTAEPTLFPTPLATPTATLIEGAPPPVEVAVTVTETVGIETNPTATLTPEIVAGAIQVQIVVHQRTWVRVMVDTKMAFEGLMLPGATYTFTGKDTVEIYSGNGA